MSRQNKPGIAEHVDRADIVIVGNGIAGLTAAVEARRLASDKRIAIITDQSHPTINTPALKQFAISKLAREQLLAYPAGTERAQTIHVINTRVEKIFAQGKYISLPGGRGFGYDSLLIATGSAPTGLPANLPGRDFDGILTLHRLQDYLDLKRRLPEVQEAVVIGGGPHAIETVMVLLYWGISVHWLIRSDTFLPRMLDRPASEMVLDYTRRAGAKIYTETEVIGIVGRVGSVAGVVTTRHQLLPCQLVLVCTGTTPVTSLAQNCDLPLQHRQGILVDDSLRTSTRDVYAAGDVAALRDPQTGRYSTRAQWYAAVLQGRVAAAAMTGTSHQDSFGVPWHATRLGELSMLTVGNPLLWREAAAILTNSSKGSYRRLTIIDDRLIGYLSLGPAQPDSLAIKRIIDEGLSIRDIKKDLLKGKFDARTYFSRKRTFAAQRMVTTGKLPTPLPPALDDMYVGAEVPLIHGRDSSRSYSGSLRVTPETPARLARVLPNTGPLIVQQESREVEHRIVDSTLAALPSRSVSQISRNLWSYSDKIPAFQNSKAPTRLIPKRRKQFMAPAGTSEIFRD